MNADLSQFYQVFFEETAEHLAGSVQIARTYGLTNPGTADGSAVQCHSRLAMQPRRVRIQPRVKRPGLGRHVLACRTFRRTTGRIEIPVERPPGDEAGGEHGRMLA